MMRNWITLCFLLVLIVCDQVVVCAVSSKIKHVVVLMEENRSFDHMFGWYAGVNGLSGKESNPISTKDPKSKHIYVDKLEPMIAPCDPDHGTSGTTSKIFGAEAVGRKDFSNASMIGFVECENSRGNSKSNYCDVMSMLTPEHVPVISKLASEFALMDRFFAAYPGPTWPNRLFMLSATAAGLTSTGPWYQDKDGQLFPQESFFDQLTKEGMTWRNYYNDTPWELFLQSISHNPENLAPLDQFFDDAMKGHLPSFAWINPRSGINITLMQGSNDQHPDHDMSLGEQLYKDIYEALRSSPQWNETLFVITYDEHGGYYDHVPTPLNVPPPGDSASMKSYPDKGVLFDRLGVRLPTLLISPWIPKGLVVSAPPPDQKPANNSEYSLTSIIATTRKLFNMKSGPLTKRDAWSATFEQVLSLSSPRLDCVLHLPPSLPPAREFSPKKEAMMPVNDLQKHIMSVHAHLAGEEFPHHVQRQGQVSEWAQEKFGTHTERTKHWKNSKVSASYKVVVHPAGSSFVKKAWDVKKGSSVSFFTISLRNSSSSLWCLEYGAGVPSSGAVVSISTCYPSADPNTNRDESQQWIWRNDATVRPAKYENLCLTNAVLEGDEKAYLKTCILNNVEQYWAYHGASPGNDDDGDIFFGDVAYAIGIVNA